MIPERYQDESSIMPTSSQKDSNMNPKPSRNEPNVVLGVSDGGGEAAEEANAAPPGGEEPAPAEGVLDGTAKEQKQEEIPRQMGPR